MNPFRRIVCLLAVLGLAGCGVDQREDEEALTEEQRLAHNAPDAQGTCPSSDRFQRSDEGGLLWERVLTANNKISRVIASVDQCGNYSVAWEGEQGGFARLFPDGTTDWSVHASEIEDRAWITALTATAEGGVALSAGSGVHVFLADGTRVPDAYPTNLSGLKLAGLSAAGSYLLGYNAVGLVRFTLQEVVWTAFGSRYVSRENIAEGARLGAPGIQDARFSKDSTEEVLVAGTSSTQPDSSHYVRVDGEPPAEPTPIVHTVYVKRASGVEATPYWEKKGDRFAKVVRLVQGRVPAVGYTLDWDYPDLPETHIAHLDGEWDTTLRGSVVLQGAVTLASGDILALGVELKESQDSFGTPMLTKLSATGEVLRAWDLTEEWGTPTFDQRRYYSGSALLLSPDERTLLVAAPTAGGAVVWVGALDVDTLK